MNQGYLAVGERSTSWSHEQRECCLDLTTSPLFNGGSGEICPTFPFFSLTAEALSPLVLGGLSWRHQLPDAQERMPRSSRLSVLSLPRSPCPQDLPASPHTCGWSLGGGSRPRLIIRMTLGAFRSTNAGSRPERFALHQAEEWLASRLCRVAQVAWLCTRGWAPGPQGVHAQAGEAVGGPQQYGE